MDTMDQSDFRLDGEDVAAELSSCGREIVVGFEILDPALLPALLASSTPQTQE